MKNCRALSITNHFFKTQLLIWEGAVEIPETAADQKLDLPFTFAMCDEIVDRTLNQGQRAIYGDLCRIKTDENLETSNWVRQFVDQMVQKLDPKAFDAAKNSAQRWEALKKLIPQRSDLDNLIELVQRSTDFKIHYGRGILVVAFETPKGPQKYHVIINENLASKFIGETEWFKAWVRDQKKDREWQPEEDSGQTQMGNDEQRQLIERAKEYNTPQKVRARLDEIIPGLSEGVREKLSEPLAEISQLLSHASLDDDGSSYVSLDDFEKIGTLLRDIDTALGISPLDTEGVPENLKSLDENVLEASEKISKEFGLYHFYRQLYHL